MATDAEYDDEVANVQALLDKLASAIGSIRSAGANASASRAANQAADKLLLEVDRGLSPLNTL